MAKIVAIKQIEFSVGKYEISRDHNGEFVYAETLTYCVGQGGVTGIVEGKGRWTTSFEDGHLEEIFKPLHIVIKERP